MPLNVGGWKHSANTLVNTACLVSVSAGTTHGKHSLVYVARCLQNQWQCECWYTTILIDENIVSIRTPEAKRSPSLTSSSRNSKSVTVNLTTASARLVARYACARVHLCDRVCVRLCQELGVVLQTWGDALRIQTTRAVKIAAC